MSPGLAFPAEAFELLPKPACGSECKCHTCEKADPPAAVENLDHGESEAWMEEGWSAERNGEVAEAPTQKPGTKGPRVPIPCVEVTPEQLGFQNAGFLAEAVLHILYLRDHRAAFATGQINVDTKLPGFKPQDIGAFLKVDREVAGAKTCNPRCQADEKFLRPGLRLRPDILDLAAREFYEIKPKTDSQVARGRRELALYQCVLNCIFNHRRALRTRLRTQLAKGTKFTPPASYQLFSGRLGKGFVRINLKMSRPQPGLITYHFCITGAFDLQEVIRLLRDRLMPFFQNLINTLREHGDRIGQLVLPPGQILVPVPIPIGGNEPRPVPVYTKDVFDELADRLFTNQELAVIFCSLLLMPVVVVGIAFAAPALAAFVTELGIAGTALGGLLRGAAGLITASARVAAGSAAAGALLLSAREALAAAPPGSPNRARAADDAARKARMAGDAANAATRAAAEAEASARAIPAARVALAGEIAKLSAAASRGQLPPEMAGRVLAETTKLERAAANAARDPRTLVNQNNAAARKATGDAAEAAALAKAAGGKIPSGGQAACDDMVNRIELHAALRNGSSTAGQLVATPDVRHPAGQTTLIVRNPTRFPADIFIAGATCSQFALAAGTTSAEIVLVPGTTRLAARISDLNSKPPRFGFAFGSQTFQRGLRHRMKLEATE